MTDNAGITWSMLIPVKVLGQAKSRLAGLALMLCSPLAVGAP